MRADLEIIQEWIPAGSRVLDLGCGNGELLAWLAEHKRAGVPVYVYYDPTGGETELPQILTVDALTTLKV